MSSASAESAQVAAFVGLGGNIGPAVERLRAVLAGFDRLSGTRLLRASGLYRTAPWGLLAQPAFVNAVAMLETRLPAIELLGRLQAIEREHGRDRAQGPRWGPRTLDLDLLLYGDATVDAPGLQLPHPRMHERAFVLLPLAQIAPDVVVPGHGRVRDLAAAMAGGGVEAIG